MCLFFLILFVLIITITYSIVDLSKWHNELLNQTKITGYKNQNND
jgi:hypothetical protein